MFLRKLRVLQSFSSSCLFNVKAFGLEAIIACLTKKLQIVATNNFQFFLAEKDKKSLFPVESRGQSYFTEI